MGMPGLPVPIGQWIVRDGLQIVPMDDATFLEKYELAV